MRARISVGTLGFGAVAWGVWTLLTNQRTDQVLAAALWLAGGVVAHDAVLAPLAIGIGWLFARLLPPWVRGRVVGGAMVLATVTLVALPVLGGWGRRADNPSLLPLDYWAGWLLVAAIVAGVVAVMSLVGRRRHGEPRG